MVPTIKVRNTKSPFAQFFPEGIKVPSPSEMQKRVEAEPFNIPDDEQNQQLQQQKYIQEIIKNQIIKHHGIYELPEIPSNLNTSTQKASPQIQSSLSTSIQQQKVIMAKSDNEGSQKGDKRKKKIYLFDNKESHPVEEYKPDKEEEDSTTPSFVLEASVSFLCFWSSNGLF